MLFVLAGLAAATLAFAGLINLTSTVRDFKGRSEVGGHADFQYRIASVETGRVAAAIGGDGKPVYASPTNSPTSLFTTAPNFDQWQNDVAGVNKSSQFTLTANETAAIGGIYQYTNNDFLPISDGSAAALAGQTWGNTLGQSKNFHFTFEMQTTFTCQPGQTFSFIGDDDLWVFINGQRVINLGGVHSAQTASVDFNTLGLTAGNNYSIALFFAERHTARSNFSFTTSITLLNVIPLPTGAAMGMASMGQHGPRGFSSLARVSGTVRIDRP